MDGYLVHSLYLCYSFSVFSFTLHQFNRNAVCNEFEVLEESGTATREQFMLFLYSLFYRKEPNIADNFSWHLQKLRGYSFGTAQCRESPKLISV